MPQVEATQSEPDSILTDEEFDAMLNAKPKITVSKKILENHKLKELESKGYKNCGELDDEKLVYYCNDESSDEPGIILAEIMKNPNEDGWLITKTTQVLIGLIKRLFRIKEDTSTLYTIEIKGHLYTDLPGELIKLIKKHTWICKSYYANDCIGVFLANYNWKTMVAKPVPGVFLKDESNSDEIGLYIEDVVSRINYEKKMAKSVIDAYKNVGKVTSEDVENYLKFSEFYDPKEILPIMGYALMSPFAFSLKQHRSSQAFIPFLHPYSIAKSTGKTKGAKAYSTQLFGSIKLNGEDIDSVFRFAAWGSSFCGPVLVDEFQHFAGKSVDFLKSLCENHRTTSRGNRNQELSDLFFRINPFFTANGFPFTNETVIKRFVPIHFSKPDSKREIEKNEAYDELRGKLRPIGFKIIEKVIKDIDGHLMVLEKRIQKHAKKIRRETYSELNLHAERAYGFGFMYEGLKIWERVAEEYNLNWTAPGYKDFVKKVVLPIIDDAEAFKRKVLNEIKQFLYTKGWKGAYDEKGIKWRDNYAKEIYGEKKVPCFVISNDCINDFIKLSNDPLFYSPDQLGNIISDAVGVSKEKVANQSMYMNKTRKTVKGVVIPHAVFNEITHGMIAGDEDAYKNERFTIYEIKRYLEHTKSEYELVKKIKAE